MRAKRPEARSATPLSCNSSTMENAQVTGKKRQYSTETWDTAVFPYHGELQTIRILTLFGNLKKISSGALLSALVVP